MVVFQKIITLKAAEHFKKMPDHCAINFLSERDEDRKVSVMLVPLCPGNALTIVKLISRFSFTEWLKVVQHHNLTLFD